MCQTYFMIIFGGHECLQGNPYRNLGNYNQYIINTNRFVRLIWYKKVSMTNVGRRAWTEIFKKFPWAAARSGTEFLMETEFPEMLLVPRRFYSVPERRFPECNTLRLINIGANPMHPFTPGADWWLTTLSEISSLNIVSWFRGKYCSAI